MLSELLAPFIAPALLNILLVSLQQTLAMVSVAAVISALLGLPLGVLLVVTERGHILPHRLLHRSVGTVVNLIRSTPFIILMVSIIPLTRLLVGTTVGTTAAIVPLTIAITPLFARLVEAAVREVDRGLIDAALAMGGSPWQIIRKVLVPEALPGIVAGLTVTLVSLIGYSTMAGVVGGGGLGDLGIRFGYQRFMPEVMLMVIVVLVVMVQSVQFVGDRAARAVNHRLQRRRQQPV
ncbi:D-methionine transport system permease protein [Lampropedia hyalina DSM 16112]|jgi:D-methionine transport system permease protein|uniref:D-methionine transport system permease protein n=1 Tax=Lampropedia hyalina DSM 16112 TaxID=1122156 RepID=A0A1M4TBL0_9BURK|nr:D-methionine transport system permease protein [Lampropedia hyalina DSM 16112]